MLSKFKFLAAMYLLRTYFFNEWFPRFLESVTNSSVALTMNEKSIAGAGGIVVNLKTLEYSNRNF